MDQRSEINPFSLLSEAKHLIGGYQKEFASFGALLFLGVFIAFLSLLTSYFAWVLPFSVAWTIYVITALYIGVESAVKNHGFRVGHSFKEALNCVYEVMLALMIVVLSMLVPIVLWVLTTSDGSVAFMIAMTQDQMGFARIPQYVAYCIEAIQLAVNLMMFMAILLKSVPFFIFLPELISGKSSLKLPYKEIKDLFIHHLIRLIRMIIAVIALFFMPNVLTNIVLDYTDYILEIEYMLVYLGVISLVLIGIVVITGTLKIIQSAFAVLNVVFDHTNKINYTRHRWNIVLILLILVSVVGLVHYTLLNVLLRGQVSQGLDHVIEVSQEQAGIVLLELIGLSFTYVMAFLLWVVCSYICYRKITTDVSASEQKELV